MDDTKSVNDSLPDVPITEGRGGPTIQERPDLVQSHCRQGKLVTCNAGRRHSGGCGGYCFSSFCGMPISVTADPGDLIQSRVVVL